MPCSKYIDPRVVAIPSWLLHIGETTGGAVHLYALLTMYEEVPTNEALAAHMSCSVSTVKRRFAELDRVIELHGEQVEAGAFGPARGARA